MDKRAGWMDEMERRNEVKKRELHCLETLRGY